MKVNIVKSRTPHLYVYCKYLKDIAKISFFKVYIFHFNGEKTFNTLYSNTEQVENFSTYLFTYSTVWIQATHFLELRLKMHSSHEEKKRQRASIIGNLLDRKF